MAFEQKLERLREENQKKLEQQLDEAGSNLSSERKSRGKREIILIITCLIGLVYFLPFTDFEQTSQINIPAISLKIPTKYISSAFPSIITAIYLIYLYSLISYLGVLMAYQHISNQLQNFLENKPIAEAFLKDENFNLARYSFFLPTPLIYMFKPELKFTKITRIIVQIYVGIIFNGLSYLSVILILLRVHQGTKSILLLVWNIACIIIMILSFIGIYVGFFISGKKAIKEKNKQ